MTSAGTLVLAAALTLGPRISLAQTGVVIRSTTRLVQVHVAAQDSQGRPVTGLRREDFQIFDERKQQPLTLFTVEGVVSAAAAPVAGREQKEADGTGNGYSAILLDWLNGGFGDRLRGDDAVRKALRTFQPHQKVAVYVLGLEQPNSPHPLRLVCDFSEASGEIANTIEDPLALPSPEIAETPGRFEARFGAGGRMASVQEQLFDGRNRIMDTVRALSDLADRMARLPGRKSLIWLTDGFPMIVDGNVVPGARAAEELYLSEVDGVLAKLNRVDVTVHTVNTRGLAVTGRSYGGTLREFSERTGGTMFSERNDLDLGVRTALEDMQAGYTVGFLVPEDATPGVHRIQVRINRPHVKLRFRESYELGN